MASTTYRVFRVLGLTAPQAKSLVKALSEIVVRCSYAIYLAHNSPVWPHNEDYVASRLPRNTLTTSQTPNIVTIRNHGIRCLYHFTDSSNLPSIKHSGLMSASELLQQSIPARMNSDETSRKLDTAAGLKNFVRLSFCARNPMMYVAKKEGRISNPVVLRIKLEAVSRPGVMFSNCNATRKDAILLIALKWFVSTLSRQKALLRSLNSYAIIIRPKFSFLLLYPLTSSPSQLRKLAGRPRWGLRLLCPVVKQNRHRKQKKQNRQEKAV